MFDLNFIKTTSNTKWEGILTSCNMVGSDGNVLDNSKRDHMGGVPSELNLYPTQLTKDLSTPTSKETMPLI
jgi:hypothetical protein